METAMIRSNGVFRGFVHRLWTVSLAVSILAGCGSLERQELSSSSQAATTTLGFRQWCQSWGLSCPQGPAPNVPLKDTPWSVSQWTAAAKMMTSLLNGPSQIQVTRAELDEEALQQAVAALEMDKWYDQLIRRVDTYKWQELVSGPGLVESFSAAPVTTTAASGLKMSAETTTEMAFCADPVIQLKGFSAASPFSGETAALQWVAVSATNVMDVRLGSLLVTAVPIDFVMREILGDLDVDGLMEMKLSLGKVVKALGPLMTWMSKPTRNLELDQEFFAVARAELPGLIPAEQEAKAEGLYPALDALQSLRTSAVTGQNLLSAVQLAGAALSCDMESGTLKAKVKLEREFGIKRFYTVSADTSGFEVYGMKVSIPSAFGATIAMKRVEFSPEKIIIRDVPIVGKVELKMADLGDLSAATIACTK